MSNTISDQQIQFFLRGIEQREYALQSRIARDTRDEYDDRNGYSECVECNQPLFQAGYYQQLCARCAR